MLIVNIRLGSKYVSESAEKTLQNSIKSFIG